MSKLAGPNSRMSTQELASRINPQTVYAVKRDLLTGRPLEANAQTMSARWYADTKRDGTAPVGAMTRTRRYDVLASGPASALDEEMGE